LKTIRNTYLTNRFFYLFGGLVALFVLSFAIEFLFPIAQTLLVLSLALVFVDIAILFNRSTKVNGQRNSSKVFSLGDENLVSLDLVSQSFQKLKIKVIDELPFQFQRRDFERTIELDPSEEKRIQYKLRPLERGAYNFGNLNLYLESFLGLVQRRLVLPIARTIPVYPSINEMKNFELKTFDKIATTHGIKKIRRLGHSYEFEQIKNYVPGDDYRSINWKASSRRGVLMVNQYQDERAQQVYNIIDKSRAMKMPFNGLSLMDYAINTSLVISNIALQKYDRAGLLTFSDKIGATIKADRRPNQLNSILAALYKEKERPMEANYELLYHASRKLINGRSLLMLYTNFESTYAMEHVLPILRRINNLHLLVVVFFENTEIKDFARQSTADIEDIYIQTIAQKFIAEKVQMVQKLRQYGIQTILTKPEELSINTVNKYLELKSRGLI
jgi:uncharacterized protein (DUF58 family)